MSVFRIVRTIAKLGLRELAENPQLRAKASRVVKERIVPEAKAQWEKARPGLERVTNTAKIAVKDVAEKHNLGIDPKKILVDAYQRLRGGKKR